MCYCLAAAAGIYYNRIKKLYRRCAGRKELYAMQDLLRFPTDAFTEETLRVETPGGPRQILCRRYEKLPYVAAPVDADFQSMDVTVPVAIDGEPVDVSGAAIVFAIGVGGYMSCRCGDGGSQHPEGPPDVPRGETSPGAAAAPPPMPGLAPGSECKCLALAAGMVLVEPGCRGRDNRDERGVFYGKAPAGLVDLKAAVCYIRHNASIFPGDSEKIVTLGGSAGGALSVLLGVTGNAPEYAPYLAAIGAAPEGDGVRASAALSPITNLENADGAYEWEFGPLPRRGPGGEDFGCVDAALSQALTEIFCAYQDALAVPGRDGQGAVTSARLEAYLLNTYVRPEAERFLSRLTGARREEYLAENPWIRWEGGRADFSFRDYAAHCGRMKGLPAFDDFAMDMAEPRLFGDENTPARHFTAFSLQHTGAGGQVDAQVQKLLALMNPMGFIGRGDTACARDFWLRHGACDNHTALPMVSDLADALTAAGAGVDVRLVWDGGHCAVDDPEAFIAWIQEKCK